jgi:hypothetical protein
MAGGVPKAKAGQASAPTRSLPFGSSFGPLALTAGLAGLAALSTVVTVAVRARSHAPAPLANVGMTSAGTQASPAPAPLPAERPAASPSAIPALAAAPAELSRLPSRPALPHHAAPRASSLPGVATTRHAAVPTEADLLRRAQEALRDAPARALALVEEHASLYRTGALAQERDVIGVEALIRLGRRDQARAAAQRFLDEHPDSPHRGHVEALLARSN